MTQRRKTYKFKAEIQQLLHILVHSLYTDKEIFLRELISNAVDALNRVQFQMLTQRQVLDPDAELAIRITADEEARTITVSDSGIGMTRDEVVRNLGTIAQSGAAAFLQQLAEMGEQERPPLEMIGQFGVGFYSAFMVADEIRVVSRSYVVDEEAVEWVSDGGERFRVAPAEREHRGTDVIVKLKADAAEFASTWKLEQVVKKHSDFVAFPIYVGDKDQPINRRKPLWRQSPRDVSAEEYDEFYKHLTLDFEKPLVVSHLVSDVPVDIHSVLYVPAHRDRGVLSLRTDHGLKLYARGVLIQEYNKELLPNYLRFVEGVVESEDLPLNVSRETVQRDPAARRIQKGLVGRLVRELETLAEEKPEDYARFWDQFGAFVKEGMATDPVSKDDLVSLLRFHSSRGEDLVSLAGYVEHMAEGQTDIYYLLAEDLESAARSSHLDYFRASDYEVLFLVDPVDSFLVMTLTEFEGHPLRNVDDASLELPEREAPEAEDAEAETIPDPDFNKLLDRFAWVLGDKVTDVRASKMLRDSPCRLVSPAGEPGQDMHRVYKLLGKEYEVPKKILEINRRHPLIRNLAGLVTETSDAPVIDLAIEQLFENQLLLEGLHPNPAAMTGRIQTLMEAAIGPREEVSGVASES